MKIRNLLIQSRTKKGLSINALAKACGLANHTAIAHLENCINDGQISTWKKIQKVLSIKDKDMWAVITTYKYVDKSKEKSKI